MSSDQEKDQPGNSRFKNFAQLQLAFQFGTTQAKDLPDPNDREMQLAFELGRAARVPPTTMDKFYPTALMYRQNELYYYAASCCQGSASSRHPGKVVSNVELAVGCPGPMGGGGPVIEESSLNKGDDGIPHGVGTRSGLSFGVYIDPGVLIAIPSLGQVANVSDIQTGYSVVDFQGANLKSLTWYGYPAFGNSIGFRIKQVTYSGNKYLAAHAVTVVNAGALTAIPLSAINSPPDNSMMFSPYLGRVDDPGYRGNETLDIAITLYS